MENNLTDRQFWVTYWENKKNLDFVIPPTYTFSGHLAEIVRTEKVKTAIELGGFPGYYAIFLKKYFSLDTTLLDYFVHPPITQSILDKNGLSRESINIIEADLFNYVSADKYDLVLSCGLIEHFEDTEDIIKRHVAFLNPGGTLFITLPNFKSVNGWFQRKFDHENYEKHNIQSMNVQLLKNICEGLGLKNVKAGYHGKFSVWLEPEKKHSAAVHLFKKIVWLTGKIFTKIIPIEHKFLAPYIVVQATK